SLRRAGRAGAQRHREQAAGRGLTCETYERTRMSSEAVDHNAQVEAVREAFEREFGRFARFQDDEGTQGLTLDEAETQRRELKELSTRHTAKKSAVTQLMKLVGRVPAEERAAFGKIAQELDKEIRGKLEKVGLNLDYRIA